MEVNEIKKLLLTTEYDFLRNDYHLGNRILLLTLGGSHAYGTNHAESDVDIRGIAAEYPNEIIGMSNFEVFEERNTDTVIYGFNKMFKLLYQCNPNTIEILGTKPEHLLYVTEAGQMLRDNSHLFLSQQAQYPFAGYAKDQLYRLKSILIKNLNNELETQRHIAETMDNRLRIFNDRFTPVTREQINLYVDESDKNTIDEELFMDIVLSRYPLRDFLAIYEELQRILKTYSSANHRNKKKDDRHVNKHAAHLIRLYLMAIDIFEKEQIITYREENLDILKSIINGTFQKEDGTYRDEFFQMVEDYKARLDRAIKETSLPEKPDFKKLEELKMEINRKLLKM